MKHLVYSTALTVMLTAAAIAQTTPAPAPATPAPAPSTTGPGASAPAARTEARPAVNGAPLENGANSFTEDQAKSRLESAGITGVTGLAKDDNGVWRGRGTWQGRSVAIGLDFRGNISAQ